MNIYKWRQIKTGSWINRQYNERGKQIYMTTSSGFWAKWVYNEKNKITHSENSYGSWSNHEYDEQGRCIFTENDVCVLYDRRPKIELTIPEIADKLGISVEQLRIKE